MATLLKDIASEFPPPWLVHISSPSRLSKAFRRFVAPSLGSFVLATWHRLMLLTESEDSSASLGPKDLLVRSQAAVYLTKVASKTISGRHMAAEREGYHFAPLHLVRSYAPSGIMNNGNNASLSSSGVRLSGLTAQSFRLSPTSGQISLWNGYTASAQSCAALPQGGHAHPVSPRDEPQLRVLPTPFDNFPLPLHYKKPSSMINYDLPLIPHLGTIILPMSNTQPCTNHLPLPPPSHPSPSSSSSYYH